MTSNLWNFTLGDGTLGNLTPPDELVEAQCKHLIKMTGGLIIARISAHRNHDASDDIGDRFQYEFYLTSTHTPNN